MRTIQQHKEQLFPMWAEYIRNNSFIWRSIMCYLSWCRVLAKTKNLWRHRGLFGFLFWDNQARSLLHSWITSSILSDTNNRIIIYWDNSRRKRTIFSSEDAACFQSVSVDSKATDHTQFEGTTRLLLCEEDRNSHHLSVWPLLETKEQPEEGYCCKTPHWDLCWLPFTGLVCWIEFAHQKGCFAQHFVVLTDVSQPAPFWHRCWDGRLLPFHLSSPAQSSLLQWKQYLSRSVLSPLEFSLCQMMIGV